jgi:dipeptidase
VWSYYNRFLPKGQADQWWSWVSEGTGEVMPLWVKPEHKVSATDLKWMMRDHFEGTPYDMTTDIGAGPFDVPYRWRPLTFKVDSVEYCNERAIATQQTGFSFVASTSRNRHEAMRGVLWFGVDDANTCVYIPVFNSTPIAPHELAPGNGNMYTISWDAMFWVNNYVANQAYNRYSQMIPDIRRVQSKLEDAYTATVDSLATALPESLSYKDAQARLWQVTASASAETTTAYKALGDYLLVKFMDGNIKRETEPGKFEVTPEGIIVAPQSGGYNERYYRQIVNENGEHFRMK